MNNHVPSWRAADVYTPRNASKTGLLAETRSFLLAYDRLRDTRRARDALISSELPQRSRTTRATIVEVIQQRITRWNPPVWVLDDLIVFAKEPDKPNLASALLLHVARQDALLYAVIKELVVPRWLAGDRELQPAHLQRMLDQSADEHGEIARWSISTRRKLIGNTLAIMAAYGLVSAPPTRRISEPVVLPEVADHLVKLLRAEGVAEEAIVQHQDWKIWLWDERRIRVAMNETREMVA